MLTFFYFFGVEGHGYISLASVVLKYNGLPMKFVWEEYGFELCCHESSSISAEQVVPLTIDISVTTTGKFCFPDNHELVSGVYILRTSKKFPATIKLQHCLGNNLSGLTFAISSDCSPPFKFECINGGEFAAKFGTIRVAKFSLFSILWDMLFPPPNVLYNVYLCHSIQPKCHSIQPKCHSIQPKCHSIQPKCHSIQPKCDTHSMWNLFFFALRRLKVVEDCFNKHIAKIKENLSSIPITVEFDTDATELEFHYNIEGQTSLQLRPYSSLILKKSEIDMYSEQLGRPPMFQLQLINTNLTVSEFSFKFVINGAKKPMNTITFNWPIIGGK